MNLKVVYVLVLAAAVGVNAQTTVAPSAQCAYLYGSFPGILNATFLPSVNSACITAINALTSAIGVTPTGPLPGINYYQSVCTSTCQSFYNLYSSCYSPQQADAFVGQYCGIYNATTSCPVVYNNTAYQISISLVTSLCSGTTCNSSCMSAVVAADTYAGCCAADAINAAKVMCGLNPGASCSTIYSSNPTAPSAQCAYLSGTSGILNPNYLPSVNSECVNALNALTLATSGSSIVNTPITYYQSVCNSNCQSYYTLLSSCFSMQQANQYFGPTCGSYNGISCPVLTNLTSTAFTNAITQVYLTCSDECTSPCKSAIVSFKSLAGCCAAGNYLNALNVACGLNTLAPCPTIFSAAVTQGISMLTVAFAAFLTVWL